MKKINTNIKSWKNNSQKVNVALINDIARNPSLGQFTISNKLVMYNKTKNQNTTQQSIIKRTWMSTRNLENEKQSKRKFNSCWKYIFNTEKQYTWKKMFFRIFLLILNLAVLIGFFYLFAVDWSNLISSNDLLFHINWYDWIISKLVQYKNIWGTQQWIVSLIGLFILYAVLIIILNWTGLTRPITTWEGFFLISFDLLLNFIVGLVYMGYNDTIIGGLMLQCPIALSPFILAIELTIYALYVIWKKNP